MKTLGLFLLPFVLFLFSGCAKKTTVDSPAPPAGVQEPAAISTPAPAPEPVKDVQAPPLPVTPTPPAPAPATAETTRPAPTATVPPAPPPLPTPVVAQPVPPAAPTPPPPVAPPAPTPAPAPIAAHGEWDALLRKYVSADGEVNYAGFKKDSVALNAYLADLRENPIADDWSDAKKIAYWINAYNAFTVKLIVDNHPIESIMKLDGGKVWDRMWIQLGTKTYSLNNIENDILRPVYKDARVHFAVNCAAKSCPPLLNRAWTAENLETLYAAQAKAFINNPAFNQIGPNEVKVSKIFEWYAGDFNNLVDYLNRYSTVKINPGARVGFVDYDWALNN